MIAQDVFNVLSDKYSSNIFRAVYSGLKPSSTNYIGGLNKKQYYTRLNNLALLGLIEKRYSFYRTTTFGSLIYNSQIKTMDGVVDSYWKLKSVDVLSRREDFPSEQKDTIVAEILKSTGNYKTITGKHLTGIEIVNEAVFDKKVHSEYGQGFAFDYHGISCSFYPDYSSIWADKRFNGKPETLGEHITSYIGKLFAGNQHAQADTLVRKTPGRRHLP